MRLKKERLIIANQNVFLETETIVFIADVYNQSYELNNENEVELTITNSSREVYQFVFNRNNDSYRYDAGYFPIGDYSWTTDVVYDDEMFSKSGKFTVMPVNTESLNTKANHQVLYRMSYANNGKLFYPDQFDDLYEKLKSDQNIVPVIKKQEKLMDLINLKLLFFIILGFMSFEWFMRKFHGGY